MKNSGAAARVLTFAAAVELGTGACLLVDPQWVVRWLLGAELPGVGTTVGRCFGITLVALGLACWPGTDNGADPSPAAARGMLAYNALIALYLTWLGTAGQLAGLLLWPAVVLHATVALLLITTRRRG